MGAAPKFPSEYRDPSDGHSPSPIDGEIPGEESRNRRESPHTPVLEQAQRLEARTEDACLPHGQRTPAYRVRRPSLDRSLACSRSLSRSITNSHAHTHLLTHSHPPLLVLGTHCPAETSRRPTAMARSIPARAPNKTRTFRRARVVVLPAPPPRHGGEPAIALSVLRCGPS